MTALLKETRIMCVWRMPDIRINRPDWTMKDFRYRNKKGAEYRFSVWARVAEGETPAKIRVELADTKSMGEQQALQLPM